jgi:hypothetical protein
LYPKKRRAESRWFIVKKLIPWLGGKRSLAKRIAASLPEHTCYVEPFCGGGSVFFAKAPSAVEVLNDKHLGLIREGQGAVHDRTKEDRPVERGIDHPGSVKGDLSRPFQGLQKGCLRGA